MTSVLSWLANRFPKLAREAVGQRLVIIGVLTVLLHVAIARHWITPSWSDRVVGDVTNALDVLATVVAGVTIRKVVTPVADPRNANGEILEVTDGGFDAGQATTTETPAGAAFDAPATPPAA